MVDIKVEGTATVGAEVSREQLGGQHLEVAAGQLTTLMDPIFQIGHLAQPQCGLDIGHAVVEAEQLLLVVPGAVRLVDEILRLAGDAVATQQTHGLGQHCVIGHRHAAFAGGDDLHRMEAEDGDVAVAAVAGGFILIAGTEGVAGILDDAKAIFPA